jgi:hypothetical protein
MMLPATDGGRVIPIPSPHENQRGGTMNFLCRLFLLEDKGRARFSPLRPLIGSYLAQPRQSSIACASAPLASLWLVQLAPSGGLRPALTTGLMSRADFSP